jgi:hypothetical protein
MKKSKRKVNIIIQAREYEDQPWEIAPIVYVIEDVQEDKDIDNILHAISVSKNFATLRVTNLFLTDPVDSVTACRYKATYYHAQSTFYNKPKK